MTMRFRTVSAAALAALLLTACGQSEPPAEDTSAPAPQPVAAAPADTAELAPLPDVCALVSLADLEGVLGYGFFEARPQSLQGVRPAAGCAFISAASGHPAGASAITEVSVQVSPWGDTGALQTYLADLTDPDTAVPDLAAGAFWTGEVLLTNWNGTLVSVAIRGDHRLGDDALREASAAVTRIAGAGLDESDG